MSRVSTASGSERGLHQRPTQGDTLATARGTDSILPVILKEPHPIKFIHEFIAIRASGNHPSSVRSLATSWSTATEQRSNFIPAPPRSAAWRSTTTIAGSADLKTNASWKCVHISTPRLSQKLSSKKLQWLEGRDRSASNSPAADGRGDPDSPLTRNLPGLRIARPRSFRERQDARLRSRAFFT
jgi:hypothetical protein